MTRSFTGGVAVVTGGGSGMGRQLVVQLAREGCAVATCDLDLRRAEATAAMAMAAAPPGTIVSAHRADMSDEASVAAFRTEFEESHRTRRLHLLFNNVGIIGGDSFLRDDRTVWERVFDVCWRSVYLGCREFLPLLIAADEGVVVNTSTIAAFWSRGGAGHPMTAYTAAKGAVKSFTEALMEDLRIHAPHVDVALVMPGVTTTDIGANSLAVTGATPAEEADRAGLLSAIGVPLADVSATDVERILTGMGELARTLGYVTSAAEAAATILDGVRRRRWRILTGRDAARLDRLVRADPEQAYHPEMSMTPHWIGSLCVLRVLAERAHDAVDGVFALRVDEDDAIGIRADSGTLRFVPEPEATRDALISMRSADLRDLVAGVRGVDDIAPRLEIAGDRERVLRLLAVGTRAARSGGRGS